MSQQSKTREPFVRITRKSNMSGIGKLFVRLAAIGFSILVILIFLSTVSKSSFNQVWGYIGHGAFDSKALFLKEMFLLTGIAIGLSPAYKMKFWNIGGQGQVLIGGLLTATIMIYLGNSGASNWITILVAMATAILAGGIFAAIPAVAKVQINANETLFTLMMNYVAIQLVAFATHMWNPMAAFGVINANTKIGYLPGIGSNEYGWVIVIVVALMFLMYGYTHYTKHGYELSVVGESINTAKYVGIKTKKVIIRTVFLSGAICGMVGFLYVSGVDHTIAISTSGGYGFTAIIVAWAAQFNPFIMAAISFLIVLFSSGAAGVSNAVPGLNQYISNISVGIFLLFIIGCEFFVNYKITFNAHITAKLDAIKAKITGKMPKTTAFLEKTKKGINSIDQKINDIKEAVVSKTFSFFASVFKKLKKDNKPQAVVAPIVTNDTEKEPEQEPVKETDEKEANNG